MAPRPAKQAAIEEARQEHWDGDGSWSVFQAGIGLAESACGARLGNSCSDAGPVDVVAGRRDGDAPVARHGRCLD